MELYTKVSQIHSFVENEKKANRSVAFIPTMGALHNGHLSLIHLSKKYANVTICSIYVNPSQFNNKEDLLKYPRSLDQDSRLLEMLKCDVLFAPSDKEVYPDGLSVELDLDLAHMDTCMEGAFRPGHFKGMLEVVYRLLDIIKPDFLIMGQKDFQQFTLVKQMILQMNLSVRLIIGPTLREADGLAMSSRNQRLSSPMRKNAPEIYKNLIHIKENLHSDTPGTLSMMAIENLKKAGLRPEYVDIVDGNSLSKITNPQNHSYIVACVAVWAGDVRLIDNIVVKGNTD